MHDDWVDARIGPSLPRRRHAVRPRYFARKHLIEDDPGGVYVGSVVHGLRHADLFGSHVAKGSCDAVILRGACRRGGTEEGGQPEIHEPDAATRINQDVFRLDIAMNDPGLVSVLKRFGDLRHVIERPTFGD